MALNPDEAAWVEGLLEKYSEDNTKVSDWEMGFMKDQVERWEKYGAEMRISPKQWPIFDRVAEKLKYAGRGDLKPRRDDDFEPAEVG